MDAMYDIPTNVLNVILIFVGATCGCKINITLYVGATCGRPLEGRKDND